jgi:hypothetical protein
MFVRVWPATTAHLTHYLGPDERLLWYGKPQQGIMLRSSDAMMIPFSLLWGGLAIAFEYNALETGPILMQLSGVPFVLIGVYLMIGRFFYDSWERRLTEYAITNERVLIVRTGRGGALESISLWSLGELGLDEYGDGCGTITLGTPHYEDNHSGLTGPRAVVPHFEGIPEARRVYEIIREAQRAEVSQIIRAAAKPLDEH